MTSTNPHAHLIGARVTIIDNIKGKLGLDWDEGLIVSCFDTRLGVGLHVCNPETGEVTDAVTLGAVILHPDTVHRLVHSGATVLTIDP